MNVFPRGLVRKSYLLKRVESLRYFLMHSTCLCCLPVNDPLRVFLVPGWWMIPFLITVRFVRLTLAWVHLLVKHLLSDNPRGITYALTCRCLQGFHNIVSSLANYNRLGSALYTIKMQYDTYKVTEGAVVQYRYSEAKNWKSVILNASNIAWKLLKRAHRFHLVILLSLGNTQAMSHVFINGTWSINENSNVRNTPRNMNNV